VIVPIKEIEETPEPIIKKQEISNPKNLTIKNLSMKPLGKPLFCNILRD